MAVLQQEDKENQQELISAPKIAQAPAPTATQTTPLYTAPTSTRTPGRFTNIQQYLQANIGGGQKIAQDIQKRQEQEASKIRKGIEESQRQFGVRAGEEEERLIQAQPFIQQALQAPTQLTAEDIERYRGLATERQPLPTIGELPSISGIEQAAQFARTEPGRFELLRQSLKQPSYTRGQQRLDQLLLQTQQPQALARSLQDLSRGITTTQQQAQEQAAIKSAALQELSKVRAEEATTGVGTAQKDFEDMLKGKVKTTQEEQDFLKETLSKTLGRKDLSPEEQKRTIELLSSYGYTPSQINVYDIANLEDIQPSQFLSPMEAKLERIANVEDYAKAKALAKLAGVEQTFLPEAEAKYAGTFDPKSTLNLPELQRMTQSRFESYESKVKPIEDQIADYQNKLLYALGPKYRSWEDYTSSGGMRAATPTKNEMINELRRRIENLSQEREKISKEYGAGRTLEDLILGRSEKYRIKPILQDASTSGKFGLF